MTQSASMVVLTFVTAVVTLLTLLVPMPVWWLHLPVALLVVLMGVLYGQGVRNRAQLNFQLWERLKEEGILVQTRIHWITLVPVGALIVIGALCFFGFFATLFAGVGTIHVPAIHLHKGGSGLFPAVPSNVANPAAHPATKTATVGIAWNYALLVLWFAFMFLAWVLYEIRQHTWRIITEKGLLIARDPPPIMLWIPFEDDPWPPSRYANVSAHIGILGNIFGYGTVLVPTNTNEGQEINRIWYVPQSVGFVKTLRELQEKHMQLGHPDS